MRRPLDSALAACLLVQSTSGLKSIGALFEDRAPPYGIDAIFGDRAPPYVCDGFMYNNQDPWWEDSNSSVSICNHQEVLPITSSSLAGPISAFSL
jgi:hypothetical protein